mmetsp:Transcript_50452/g.159698  ORF Transcript_50452/g.159698 Transcript_50452/m.159698 type:complete len:119 (+) Transcript_50452:74-430(+)
MCPGAATTIHQLPLRTLSFERRYVQQRGYGARNLRHAHAALCGPHRAAMALCRARLSVQSLARLCLRLAIYLSAQSSGTGAPSSSPPPAGRFFALLRTGVSVSAATTVHAGRSAAVAL